VRGIDALLDSSRAGVRRLDPYETREAIAGGALLVDTRTDCQRNSGRSSSGPAV
jgi:hypothetical protein